MAFKPTRNALLEPRDCPSCGRHMSQEFLDQRHKDRSDKIKKARKEYEAMRKRVFNRE